MNKKEAIEKLEAMLNRYDAYHPNSNEFTEYDCEDIRAVIKVIKSIEERPTGKWEKVIDHYHDKVIFRCSICGRLVKDCYHDDLAELYPYCNCGAKMGAENETDN